VKSLKYILIAGVMMISAVGCKKSFFDINQNPNAPTDASLTAGLIAPRVEHIIGARMATSYATIGRWLGYWTRSGTYGPTQEEESYNITSNFETGQWSGWYNILTDANIMEQKANAAGESYYEGIAKVVKAIGFTYLVDMYNNVPYSKAFDLAGNIQPGYDKGEDIYASVLADLDVAAKLFKDNTASSSPDISAADIIFHGDGTKWRKFVNSWRLKMIIRQSQVSGFNAAGEIAKITADGAGFLGTGETASAQPLYVPDKDKQNPFWNAYKLDYTGNDPDAYNRANNYILNKMKTTADIRYMSIFEKVKEKAANQQLDYFGYNYGENIPNDAPKSANSSKVSGPALAKSASQPQWIFTSVESMFLQAEAIQRGWLTGDAQEAYEAAVTESFIWLGLTATDATTYINSGSTVVDWALATTPEAKIKLIVLQKYLALEGINNFEAWVDYRRLGVPEDLPLSLSPNREGRKIPLRLRFPQAEINYNAKNVEAAGSDDPQTVGIFWDK
jgi:hypothetical protein